MQVRQPYWIVVLAAVVTLISVIPSAAQIEAEPAVRPTAQDGGLDVTFEEITDCGFYSQESRLVCTISIKQLNGYGGIVDTFGTFEHVLFCIDWLANGFGPDDVVGEVSVHVHDESAGANPPWNYAVYRDITPPGGVRTSNAGVGTATTATVAPSFKALAVLSWNAAPTGCNFIPTWGNRFTFQIRVDPIR